MGFVHLHVHSQYSLLDGTMDPVDVAELAKACGMPAVALTDTCNLYGAVAFYKACKDAGVKPILGAELHVQPEGLTHVDPEKERGGWQIVALVEDEVGYRNLCLLITRAIFEGTSYKPRVDLAMLRAHHEGLIFLTGGRRGPIGKAVESGRPREAIASVRALAEFLGPERLFVELSDLGLPGQEPILDMARGVASELGLKTVVTNAVHYAKADDAPVHELLHAIAGGHVVDDPARTQVSTDQAWFKTEAEMRELFPDDALAIDRTVAIAERCHFKLSLGTYHFPATTPPDVARSARDSAPDVARPAGDSAPDGGQPDSDANWAYFFRAFPPPRDFGLAADPLPPRPPGAGNLDGYFRWYCERGLDLRLARIPAERHAEYRERLDGEVRMIQRMGFPAYLLIVAEFINWSKDNDIPVGPGRGSAAGSVAAWAMRITDIDPVVYDLLFERFLNPERVSMPDIDVDFCQDRREEVIEHVRQKYGSDYVSQIITYGKLKAKAAVRDVARVLGLSFTEADRIAKLVPETLNITLADAIEQEPQLRVLRDGDPKVRRALALALAVEGVSRQTGVHAAGVVIADRPLVEYAPLYRDEPGGGPVVQYDMKSAELIGLIKFDFLGLKTLDQIRDTVKAVERNHGVRVDMSAIPVDDPDTYALLQQGDAAGIFQLESSGMRDLLTRLKPSHIDDMVALVALYRPGPLSSGMTDDFVLRKHDPSRVAYPLPVLEPILRPTYGTIVYQEQVMQIAQSMAGYSLGEADLLRRAMGKKNASEMAAQKQRFVSGSIAHGWPADRADEIFELMAKFAMYGFNKSHSAAYGYISYQTAWLKAHYRAEYMAALMTIDAANTDKVLQYIEDCRRAGIRIEPVDVNRSHAEFWVPPADQRPDGDVIYFGLAAVKNLGSSAVQAVLEARQAKGGRFDSPMAFLEAVDGKRVNKRVIENLVKAGAFDGFGLPRRAVFEGLEDAVAQAQRVQADEAAGQASLFGAFAPAQQPAQFRFSDVPEWALSEKLAAEREVLGLYLTGHPMEAFRRDVERFATCPIGGLGGVEADSEVKVIGMPVDTRVVRTRRGDPMAFVQLADAADVIECVFFSEPWTRSMKAIQSGEPIYVIGRVEHRDDGVKILADSAVRLVEERNRRIDKVRFVLRFEELVGDRLVRFKALLEDQRGECPSCLQLVGPGEVQYHLDLGGLRVEPSPALEEGVQALFGRPDVVAWG